MQKIADRSSFDRENPSIFNHDIATTQYAKEEINFLPLGEDTLRNFGSPKNPRDTEAERKRGETESGIRTEVQRTRARASLYQPPEARGCRYRSRTTPDISDG